jgi:lysozyme
MQDVAYAEHSVEHLVKVPLTENQFSALCSFVYNEGAGRLQTSTLLKVLNGGNYAAVPVELMKVGVWRWQKAAWARDAAGG